MSDNPHIPPGWSDAVRETRLNVREAARYIVSDQDQPEAEALLAKAQESINRLRELIKRREGQ